MAREPEGAVRHQRIHGFFSPDGGVRTGWLIAVSLFAYALVAVGARYGLSRAFGALFAAWGITPENARLAPVWARTVYAWHGSLVTLAVSALTLGLCHFLKKLWKAQKKTCEGLDTLLLPALAGAGIALLVAALCLMPDSIRPDWPLSAPHLTWALLPLCAVAFAGILAEEAFLKRILYDGLRTRLGVLWATGIVAAAHCLVNMPWTAGVIGGINALLLGLVACLLYGRRGLWAAVGFRWGWTMVNTLLLGFGGGDSAVYRFYGVSETLLTGGDAGPAFGLWTALALAGMTAVLFLSRPGRRSGA